MSNETSTGVRTSLPAIAKVMAKHERTMFLLDLVSYIAGAPVDFDANRIDLGFAGVQKAFGAGPAAECRAAALARYISRA